MQYQVVRDEGVTSLIFSSFIIEQYVPRNNLRFAFVEFIVLGELETQTTAL